MCQKRDYFSTGNTSSNHWFSGIYVAYKLTYFPIQSQPLSCMKSSKWASREEIFKDVVRRLSDIGVSKNHGTPKSSILIGFSIINHPFSGTPYFWRHPYLLRSMSGSWTAQHPQVDYDVFVFIAASYSSIKYYPWFTIFIFLPTEYPENLETFLLKITNYIYPPVN